MRSVSEEVFLIKSTFTSIIKDHILRNHSDTLQGRIKDKRRKAELNRIVRHKQYSGGKTETSIMSFKKYLKLSQD